MKGGHSAPSFLGAPGERIGHFAQHQYQNRGKGLSNISEGQAKFYTVESDISEGVRMRLERGQPVGLNWSMSTPSGGKPGLPDVFTLSFAFDGHVPRVVPFTNLPKR